METAGGQGKPYPVGPAVHRSVDGNADLVGAGHAHSFQLSAVSSVIGPLAYHRSRRLSSLSQSWRSA
jgi:hypothetical protein